MKKIILPPEDQSSASGEQSASASGDQSASQISNNQANNTDNSELTLAALKNRLDSLEKETIRLQDVEKENTQLKERLKQAAATNNAASMIMSHVSEVETGEFDQNDNELFAYRIDLASCAGELTINGIPYYHGVTYKFTREKLATIKSMVYQTHWHDANVFGKGNDAFYQKQRAADLMGPIHNGVGKVLGNAR